jgi:transposase-like protein
MEPGIRYRAMSLLEFKRVFPDEDSCREYLFKMRWPDDFVCPRCGSVRYSYHSTRRLYECLGCRYQCSVTAGTVFHNTRTPLEKWFWAIFLMSRQKSGVSALGLKKMLDIGSYATMWLMCNKIRKAMADRDANYKLAGLVEMDESYFGGKRSGRRGRGAEGKTIVAVCCENDGGRPGYATMKVIDAATSDELSKVANEKIEKDGTIIKTDGFKAYKSLNNQGFTQQGEKVSDKKASEVLPWVHTLIGNVKATIDGIFHGVSGKHLQRFLDECCYRFNRRNKEAELFDRLLLACAKTTTITFSEATG